ncbi:uncharacterized protein LOC123306843 [Coccinella septempunctata]|uniref:uncharacterized protein LOC123306843 n=1 Tax=Coccinella septempunctata TaxID=41139 RepID=UPI001D0952F3|nr:uncharacterized protein LOC123306843 [Coccinella septempunctata]
MKKELEQEVHSWITDTFKERNYNTIDIEFPDYDTSGGALGDIIFVNVIGRSDGSEERLNLLIKRSKSDHIVLDDMNLRVAYKNEINFYSKIVPFFKKFAEEKNTSPFENIPTCFGTVIKENLYVILMENLKPKGFKMHELGKPHDMACAKLVLEAYAKWQALCLAVKDQVPEVYSVFGANNQDFLRKKLSKLFSASAVKELNFVVGLYEEKGDKIMVEKIRQVQNNFEENYLKSISIEHCNFPVIRHGDCWNNNFLFRFETGSTKPKEVIIIDWQNSALGPPLADIAQYLLYTCSASEYENIDDLLRFYYNILSKGLRELGSDPEKCFSWNDCYENFKICIPPAVFTKPVFVRASLAKEFNTSFDLSQSPDDGDFHGLFSDELKDPDEYFKRIDDTFKIFLEKGLI